MKKLVYFQGPKIPMNQFLNRLPKSVIKNGQVIDIRQNIEQQLTVSSNLSSNTPSIHLFISQGKQEPSSTRCDR